MSCDLNAMMAELMGREPALCRDHGESLHRFLVSKGFLGDKGIVGGESRCPPVRHLRLGSGTAEASQHSQHLDNRFCRAPVLKVVMPSTCHDAKGLLKSALRDDEPVICLANRVFCHKDEPVPDGERLVPIGAAAVRREGTDNTVVAFPTPS